MYIISQGALNASVTSALALGKTGTSSVSGETQNRRTSESG